MTISEPITGPHTTSAARRLAYLAAALTIAGALLSGCGGSEDDSPDSGVPTPAATAGDATGQGKGLGPLADCVRQNGVDVPQSATRAQVLEAFRSVDKAKREQIRAACGSLAPSGLAEWLSSRAPSANAS